MSKRRQNVDYPVNLLRDIYAGEPLPNHMTEHFDSALQKVLGELPERSKDVIVFRYRDGMTYRQAGEQIGVSPERARQIIRRGLRILRNNRCRGLLDGKSERELRNGITGTRDMKLSVRVVNSLARKGIFTLNDILAIPPNEMREIRNLGKRSYDEIVNKLEELGYDVSVHRSR